MNNAGSAYILAAIDREIKSIVVGPDRCFFKPGIGNDKINAEKIREVLSFSLDAVEDYK